MPIQRRNYFDEDETDSAPEKSKTKDAGALLPRSILGGKEIAVGDRIVLEVTGVHDDQLAVAYPVGAKEETEETDDTTETAEAEPGEGATPPDDMSEEREPMDMFA